MTLLFIALFLLQVQPAHSGPVLNNAFVRVMRNAAPCASGAAGCGDRVIIALGPLNWSDGIMKRGDVRVIPAGQSYRPPAAGEFLEVSIKPGHPQVAPPPAGTPAAPDNKVLFDAKDFTIFEEKMQPGEISSRHSHNQRVAIFLNDTMVEQWTDGKDETRELEPDLVTFRPAVIHISKDVGKVPIQNLLIEFKPAGRANP